MRESRKPFRSLPRPSSFCTIARKTTARSRRLFDYKFIGFSHNPLRGAAGGAVLLAELLAAKGYFD